MIKFHELRYGKQGPVIGYSRVKLMNELNYEVLSRERLELLRINPNK